MVPCDMPRFSSLGNGMPLARSSSRPYQICTFKGTGEDPVHSIFCALESGCHAVFSKRCFLSPGSNMSAGGMEISPKSSAGTS